MKRIMSLILVSLMLVSALFFASCGKGEDDVPNGMKKASGDAAQYVLYVPTTWKCDVASGATSATYSDSDTSNISVMTFSLENSDADVSDWWSGFEADFKKVYDDFEIVSREDTTLDGEKAEKVVFKGTLIHDLSDEEDDAVSEGTPANDNIDKVEFQFMQVSAVKRKVLSAPEVYVITYTSSPDVFDSHLEDVQKCLDNFKFN